MSRNQKNTTDQTWLSREDLQDIAKIGGDLLKRTVTSGFDVIKDVTDNLPKDAQQIITKSREEVLKGISREFAQNLVSLAVEKVFTAVREHRLDISIRVRKDSDKTSGDSSSQQSDSPQSTNENQRRQGSSGENQRHGFKRNHPNRHHP